MSSLNGLPPLNWERDDVDAVASDAGLGYGIGQHAAERLLGPIVAEQHHGKASQEQILRTVVPQLTRDHAVATRVDREVPKVTQRAAHEGDAPDDSASVAPDLCSRVERVLSARGEGLKGARPDGADGAQTASSRLVREFERGIGR